MIITRGIGVLIPLYWIILIIWFEWSWGCWLKMRWSMGVPAVVLAKVAQIVGAGRWGAGSCYDRRRWFWGCWLKLLRTLGLIKLICCITQSCLFYVENHLWFFWRCRHFVNQTTNNAGWSWLRSGLLPRGGTMYKLSSLDVRWCGPNHSPSHCGEFGSSFFE